MSRWLFPTPERLNRAVVGLSSGVCGMLVIVAAAVAVWLIGGGRVYTLSSVVFPSAGMAGLVAAAMLFCMWGITEQRQDELTPALRFTVAATRWLYLSGMVLTVITATLAGFVLPSR